MSDCGCFSTQPWWRPYSVAWIVTSQGTMLGPRDPLGGRRRRASRASGPGRSPCVAQISSPSAAMWSFMSLDPDEEPLDVPGERRLADAMNGDAVPNLAARQLTAAAGQHVDLDAGARRAPRRACGRGDRAHPRSPAGTPTRPAARASLQRPYRLSDCSARVNGDSELADELAERLGSCRRCAQRR